MIHRFTTLGCYWNPLYETYTSYPPKRVCAGKQHARIGAILVFCILARFMSKKELVLTFSILERKFPLPSDTRAEMHNQRNDIKVQCRVTKRYLWLRGGGGDVSSTSLSLTGYSTTLGLRWSYENYKMSIYDFCIIFKSKITKLTDIVYKKKLKLFIRIMEL